MIQNVLIHILAFIAAGALIYFILAFVRWEWDWPLGLEGWDPGSRFFFLLFYFLMACVFDLLAMGHVNDR